MSEQVGSPRWACYYAHSKMIYNKAQERNELELLRRCLEPACQVINPHADIIPQPENPMEPYLRAVGDSDLVVASEYEYSGHVGKGVAEEIQEAIRKGIPCVVLRPAPPTTALTGSFGWLVTQVGGTEPVNRDDWRVDYAAVATTGAAYPAEEWFRIWLARCAKEGVPDE